MPKHIPKLIHHLSPSGLAVLTFDRIKVVPGNRYEGDRAVVIPADPATLETKLTKPESVFQVAAIDIAEREALPRLTRQLRRRRAVRGWALEALDARSWEELGVICTEYAEALED